MFLIMDDTSEIGKNFPCMVVTQCNASSFCEIPQTLPLQLSILQCMEIVPSSALLRLLGSPHLLQLWKSTLPQFSFNSAMRMEIVLSSALLRQLGSSHLLQFSKSTLPQFSWTSPLVMLQHTVLLFCILLTLFAAILGWLLWYTGF